MRHIQFFKQIDGVNVIAVPNRVERVTELTEQGMVVAQSVAEAANLGATLCVIASNTGKHAHDCLEALDSGMSLLVEKPLATNASEAKTLSRRAEETGGSIFVGCVLRFSESLNTFQQMLGQVGVLHSVRIEAQSYLPDWQPERSIQNSFRGRSQEGGVLLDLVHDIDSAGTLFGWPVAVNGRVRNLGRLGIGADEIAELSWETQNGCAVSISLDYLTRPARRRINGYGDLGTIEWDGIEGTTIIKTPPSPVRVKRSSQTRNKMFMEQTHAFLHSINGNCDLRIATCEDGIKALAVCDAARKSSESERIETVEYT